MSARAELFGQPVVIVDDRRSGEASRVESRRAVKKYGLRTTGTAGVDHMQYGYHRLTVEGMTEGRNDIEMPLGGLQIP